MQIDGTMPTKNDTVSKSELSDLLCGNNLLKVVFVRGVEGPSIYINDHRICGSKPWGGGDVIHTWTTTAKELFEAIGIKI